MTTSTSRFVSGLRSLVGLAALGTLFAACPTVPPPDPLEAPPRVISFTASAGEVAKGSTITLSWSVENAKSLKIEEVRLGAVSGVSGDTGSVDVIINDDSLFVLTVRNDRGASDTAVAVIHVGSAAGELLLTALPNSINAGESVTLAWVAPGASSITLVAAPGGPIDVGTQVASGSVLVSPTANTTYTLTAGTRSATTTVQVKPTLIAFDVSSLSADAGSTITLSWQTANATRVQLSAPGRGTLLDEMDAQRIANGSFMDTLPTQVDPGQFFAYQLTVTGAGVTLTDSKVVSISGNPAVLTFTAPTLSRDPAAGLFPDGGSPPSTIRLTWTTREASSVTLSANGSDFYSAPLTDVASGSLDVPPPPVDTTYVITAAGARGGAATSTKLVDVVGLPTVTLSATPSSVMGGSPVAFDWTGTDVRTVTLSSTSLGTMYANAAATDTGSVTRYPPSSEAWTLVAGNGVGDFTSSTTNVTVSSPILFTVSDPGTLRQGQNLTLSWTGSMMSQITGLAHDGVDIRALGFDDISMTGTALVFPATGNSVASIDTGFRTTLFGQRVGQAITVSKNGYLVFGSSVNGTNSVDEPLPSSKLEPLSVAPYWESLTIGAGVFWQVKTVAGVEWLIVQWNTSTATFQARIASSGRIDFDYAALPTSISGRVGVVGTRPNQFVAGAAVPDAGLTFFGPRAMPVTVRATVEGPVAGNLEITPGNFLPLVTQLGPIVNTNDLSVTEVMSRSSVAEGNWVEVRNTRDVALDLAGWTFNTVDGGTIAVTGTVPARGVLVLGSTTDPALNDDAGVSVALTGFDGLRDVGSLVFGRGGAHNTISLTAADAGRAVSFEPGRIVPTPAITCAATATYGTQVPLQLGTPGRDTGCGFPYALSSAAPGYFDISGTGTGLVPAGGNFDDSIHVGDLSAHPVPVFGTTFSTMQVSTNGFVTFDTAPASSTNYLSITTPSSSDSNTMLSVYSDDLHMNVGGGQVFLKFCAMGEDPFAAAPHWIVQWHHYGHYAFGGSLDDLNFQAKIFTSGVIEYHFAGMQSRTVDVYGSGSSAVTWLENPAGTAALTVNVSSTNPGISPNTAFRFTPR